MPELIAKKLIEINVPASKVWDVLVQTQFINQWDEVPEDFEASQLSQNSKLRWAHGNENNDYTQLTVTDFEPHRLLKERWYSSPVAAFDDLDIYYMFELSEKDGKTVLNIMIGDWSVIDGGQDYYDASVEFAEGAAQKIKELAEL